MKDLEFLSIEITEFKCFRETVSLTLDTEAGLYFMSGRNEVEPRLGANGAGKSSVWDALRWCLYGKGTKGLSSTDIRPWGHKSKTSVTVTWSINGKKHVCTRSLTPNLTLLDGKEVGNEQVEAALGLSATVFDNTILLGQGAPLFFDLGPTDKMELFADVLNMERWERRSDRASEKASAMTKLETDLELEHARQIAAMEEVEAMIVRTEGRKEEWRQERKARLADFDIQIETLRKDLIQLQKLLDQADLKSDGSGTEAKALRKELGTLSDKLRKAQAAQAQAEVELNATDRSVQRAESALAELGKEKKCPTCGQPIKKEGLKTHQTELQVALRETQEELKRAEQRFRSAQAAAASLASALADSEACAAEFLRKEEEASRTVNRIRPEIAAIKARLADREAAKTELENGSNPYAQQLNELKRQKSNAENDAKILSEELDKLRRSFERTRFWVTGFKEMRLFSVEEMLHELNLSTTAALESLGLINWQVQYDIERETKKGTIKPGLNVSILSPKNEKPVRWECWSGGEAQRLRVAGALALSEVLLNHAGIQVNLEIIDEPTRGLTAGGSRDLYEYLAERAKHINRRTWYIDHLAVQSSAFTAAVAVVKTAAGSYIET
jgi:DNA repair exonuclease SbcCD ATPase subunit